ncbi:TPA: hypothetical protein ACH3X1_010836 [Trebouxia sp. C0004]
MGMTHSSIRNRSNPALWAAWQIKSYLLIQPPDEAEFHTHEAEPKAKQQRTLSAEDVGSLDVTGLAQYESLNPQPPPAAAAMVDLTGVVKDDVAEQEEVDDQSAEDVTDFFCATHDYEQQGAAAARQDQLDVDLHYNFEAAFWMGEYVALGEEKECQAFGDDPTAKDIDLDALLAEAFKRRSISASELD